VNVAEKLAALIRFPTVARPEGGEDAAAFKGCRQAILDLYPRVAAACAPRLVAGRGVVLRWRGRGEGAPWVLMAHYDVVPAPEPDWEHPPFSGHVAEGYVHGRGALDTKGTLAAMLQAAEELLAAGFTPRQDVFFCFSGDEETYGPTTGEIIRFLRENGKEPDFVLDEGGRMTAAPLPGFSGLAAMVGVAEKGMAQVLLKVKGPAGHASRPPRETQADVLVQAMDSVRRNPWPQRLTEPVRESLRALAAGCAFPWSLMYQYPESFLGVIFRRFERLAGEENALTRTTCALTRLSGGSASNVLPGEVSAGYNLRLLPGDTPEGAAERMREVIGDPRVQVELAAGNPPSPVSEIQGGGFLRLRRAVSRVWPGAVTAPLLMTGATDAYYYSLFCPRVYRFSPLPATPEETACVHAANERVSVKALTDAVAFYKALLEGDV